ncbi:hypothetical protein BRADI_1g06645v3 [Brachypodium distachyon]|uniref:Uncharacterized protein n=1 Tax=Brachypodium distachyon TaxID=15368 RepID=A0A2K2DIC7_BRADI|nr:hypothetical protein BRADI_1g06645v3 [Brachypodium distachyon]
MVMMCKNENSIRMSKQRDQRKACRDGFRVQG